MAGLNPYSLTGREGSIHLLRRRSRIDGLERLRLKGQRPVRRPGFLSVNRKGQGAPLCGALHINRRIIRILELQILVGTGDGRVHRRLDISHRHGVVLSLNDFHFRKQRRVIQCRRNLADAAADAVYGSSILIRRCRPVSVFYRKRLHTLIARENLSGHQHMTVDLRRAHLQVRRPGRAAGAEAGRKGSQDILDRRKILRCDLRLLLRRHRLHADLAGTRLHHRLGQGRLRRFQINRSSRLGRRDHKLAVFPGDGSVCRLRYNSAAFFIHKRGYLFRVRRDLDGKLHRRHLKILCFHITPDQVAGGNRLLQRFLKFLLIPPGKSQLSGPGLRLVSVDDKDHFLIQLFFYILAYRLLCFLCRHSGKIQFTRVNSLRQRLRRKREGRGHCQSPCRK